MGMDVRAFSMMTQLRCSRDAAVMELISSIKKI
jgi:hypothetical protein